MGNQNVFIATCDKVIQNHVNKYTPNVIMTSNNHLNACTRIYEAYIKIKKKYNLKIKNIILLQEMSH